MFMMRKIATLLLLLLAACGPRLSDEEWRSLSAPTTFRLGVGDRVRVEIIGKPELSRQVSVRPDGYITIPLAGEIKAAGRLPEEVSREAMERLRKYVQEPHVTLTVQEVRSYVVYILGEAQRPGEFRPQERLTVLQAVALAGGFTPFASPSRIVVIRKRPNKEIRIPIDYDVIISGDQPEQNIYLHTGDTLVIP